MNAPSLFEVTSVAATAAARRLTTAANVTAALKLAAGTDTTLIESIIDGISADAARYCRLARDPAYIPTFGQEICRATWYVADCDRGENLILPWRAPITAIGSIVESDATLVNGTDFKLMNGGLLLRLCGDRPACWSRGKIVGAYTAGWSLPTGVPPDVERRVIDQVKMMYLSIDRNPAVRSESVPDVYQAAYNVAGGDSIGESGLMVELEAALAPYRSVDV